MVNADILASGSDDNTGGEMVGLENGRRNQTLVNGTLRWGLFPDDGECGYSSQWK